jgi:cytoskeletal protein CcmA (bactofilin family)
MSNDGQKTTLVEEGTEVVGTIRAKTPLVVRGSIEGDLVAPSVSITDSGRVQGNVKATKLQSSGSLAGSVEADEVSLAGEVKSDTVIRARTLEVKLHADKGQLQVTFGDCLLDVGDDPASEAGGDAGASEGTGSDGGGGSSDAAQQGRKGKKGKKNEAASGEAASETTSDSEAAAT